MSTIKIVNVDSTQFYTPPWVGGDTEFAGHGPSVNLSVNLSIKNQRELWAKVTMDAKETRSNWTEARGTEEFMVYIETEHRAINRIVSDSFSSASYIDKNIQTDWIPMPADELVKEFECIGDTSGADIAVTTLRRTGVRVHFNPVTIEVDDSTWPPTNSKIVEAKDKWAGPVTADDADSGDREFAGHGPRMDMTVELSIKNYGHEIWAHLTLIAWELRDPVIGTRVEQPTIGTGTKDVRVVASDVPILEIISAKKASASVISIGTSTYEIGQVDGSGYTTLEMGKWGLVKRFNYVGDTYGNDVGTSTCDPGKTRFSAHFNPIKYLVKK